MTESMALNDDILEFRRTAETDRLSIDRVTRVDRCHLAERAMQGDETFHILHSVESFWLIGPFVAGGLKAMDDLLTIRPDTPTRDVTVNHVPWAFRKPGWFGLRLYSTPGFVKMPVTRLQELRLSSET